MTTLLSLSKKATMTPRVPTYRQAQIDIKRYIEEKGAICAEAGHQRNQPVSADRVAHGFGSVSRAS